MTKWRLRCTRCGVLTTHLSVNMAHIRASLHGGKCKGTVAVERVS